MWTMDVGLSLIPTLMRTSVQVGRSTDNWREGGWTVDFGLSLIHTYVRTSVREGRDADNWRAGIL